MAQPTNTQDRYDLATNGDTVREDLTDVITNISPTETPFGTNAMRGTAESDLHEWQIDALAAAVSNNWHIDGDDFSGDALDDPERIGNYCGIPRKDIVVSRRANRVRKAGIRNMMSYQIAKKGKELKRDVESALTANNAAVQGNATTASEFAGLGAWLKTNTDRGAGGADPALSSTTYGVPTTAATDGTDRALSESGLLALLASIYTQGGDPDCIMMEPTVKQLFSQYMFGSSARIATPYQDFGRTPGNGVQVVGAVDVYISDFGVLEVLPNRFQRADDVFILDMDLWEVAYLDGYRTEDIAKTGDSEKKMLLADLTLVSLNEAGSGIYADVDETTAMVA